MALETNLVANWKGDSLTDNKGGFVLTNNNSVGIGVSELLGSAFDFGAANTNKSLTIANDLGVNGAGALASINLWVKMRTQPSSGQRGGLAELRDATGLFMLQIYDNFINASREAGVTRQRFAVANDRADVVNTLGTVNKHMMTLTYDGSTLRIYLDGSSLGSVASSGNGVGSTTDRFMIGVTDADFASAYIGDVSVWNTRAISGAEITSLWNSGTGLRFNGTIFVPPSSTLITKIAGVSIASVKNVEGLAIASVKKLAGVANT